MRSLPVVALVFLLSTTVFSAPRSGYSQDWEASFGTCEPNSGCRIEGWQGNTGITGVEIVESGGTHGRYLRALTTDSSAIDTGFATCIAQPACYLDDVTGDYTGSHWRITLDLALESGVFAEMWFRLRRDYSSNGWRRQIDYAPGLGQWQSHSLVFDPGWTDGDAIAAGWIQETGAPSWAAVLSSVGSLEVRVAGSGPRTLGLDNILLETVIPDSDGDSFPADVDCNDSDPATYPGAAEICDGYDNDCSGNLDDGPSCDTTCDSPEMVGNEIRTTTTYSVSPSVVAAPGVFAVAWVDSRFGNPEIMFARFDSAGQRIGNDIRVTATPGWSARPSLVWTGSSFALAWEDQHNTDVGVFFIRLNAIGQPIGEAVLAVATTADSSSGIASYPCLVWTGTQYGLVWSDFIVDDIREVFYLGLDGNGRTLGDPVRITLESAGSNRPSLVWTGQDFGVAWYDARINGLEIHLARFDVAGTKLLEDTRVSADPRTTDARDPSLTWSGTQFGVAWSETLNGNRDIRFAAVDGLGNPLGDETIVAEAPGDSSDPDLVWTGAEYGVVWQDSRDGNSEIYFARLSPAGSQLGNPIRVTHEPDEPLATSASPTMTWTGDRFRFAWFDQRPSWGLPFNVYIGSIGCHCDDMDLDGFTRCNDCDDEDGNVYPGGPQLCDSVNNDCNDPNWPDVPPLEVDDDADRFSECEGDCDDTQSAVYPGASELCDGINNDCDNGSWPTPFPEDTDNDGDAVSECEGDCDDSDATVFPGASQLCDGINNDCLDATWPTVPAIEVDDDVDSFAECEGDCNDSDSAVHPAAAETCNAIDDNCNALVDEDGLGEDTDGDGVHNRCDNCREDVNPSQLDVDEDNVGNSCDNCILEPNPDQSDLDLDDRGDTCDNCPNDANYYQDDYEADGVGDACDNCFFDWNPTQTDMDDDYEGDICDLDDGIIYIRFHQPEWVEWQEELGFDSWNSYRGDLAVLKGAGLYTQDPSLVPLASHSCDLTVPWEEDLAPPAGAALFFLTTGNYAGTGLESGLGVDSGGNERVNVNPCP